MPYRGILLHPVRDCRSDGPFCRLLCERVDGKTEIGIREVGGRDRRKSDRCGWRRIGERSWLRPLGRAHGPRKSRHDRFESSKNEVVTMGWVGREVCFDRKQSPFRPARRPTRRSCRHEVISMRTLYLKTRSQPRLVADDRAVPGSVANQGKDGRAGSEALVLLPERVRYRCRLGRAVEAAIHLFPGSLLNRAAGSGRWGLWR